MPAPRATEAAIRRAMSAWTKAGLQVGKLEVLPDGTISISAPELVAHKSDARQDPRKPIAWD